MKCNNCGFENPEKSKFCGKCGTDLRAGTFGKQMEIAQSFYKKVIPVAGVLVVLLIVYVAIISPTYRLVPSLTEIPKTFEPAPLSANEPPMASKTSEPPTPIPTSAYATVSISPTPGKATSVSKTAILEPIEKESAGIDSGPYCCHSWYVGDDEYNKVYDETFLSYSMADIPSNATITDATLDFSQYSRTGDPFSYLGCLGVYEQSFSAPDATDFFFGTPTDAIIKGCTDGELSSQVKSKNMASALQNKVGKNMFQVRLQFDTNIDNNKQSDYIGLSSAKIIVTYTIP